MSKRFNTNAVARRPNAELDFSVSLNPLGTPVQIVRAVKVAAADFSDYPDPSCSAVVEALASREDVAAEQIVVTAGATDAFMRIAEIGADMHLHIRQTVIAEQPADLRSRHVAAEQKEAAAVHFHMDGDMRLNPVQREKPHIFV